MASVNKVILVGNCGRDPEIRYLPSGQAVANVSVATSSRRKDKNSGEMIEDTQWHRVTFYDRLAEIAFLINERQENIGARRLHTVLEKLLEKLSFEAPDKGGLSLMVDKAMVDEQLGDAVQDPDLSRYIL